MNKLFLCATLSLFVSFAFAKEPNTVNTVTNQIPAYAVSANPNVGATNDDSEAFYLTENFKITPKIHQETDQSLHYIIDATYPQITGNGLTHEALQFNERITKIVNHEIQNFKIRVEKDLLHMQTLPEEVQQNNFKIDYDLDVLHPENLTLISVRLSIEGMQAGRAHPFHSHEVLNFDLTHGKELALKDVFKSNANFLTAISNYSQKHLNKTLKEQDKWMLAQGTKPDIKNYKNWNLEEDALLITFDEYQVAPYSYGPQEIEIPYSELQALISPKTPIYSAAKNPSKTVG